MKQTTPFLKHKATTSILISNLLIWGIKIYLHYRSEFFKVLYDGNSFFRLMEGIIYLLLLIGIPFLLDVVICWIARLPFSSEVLSIGLYLVCSTTVFYYFVAIEMKTVIFKNVLFLISYFILRNQEKEISTENLLDNES